MVDFQKQIIKVNKNSRIPCIIVLICNKVTLFVIVAPFCEGFRFQIN